MSKTPKLRFKEFSGDWESKRLGELGEFFKGSTLSKTHLSEEGKPCVLYGELYTRYGEVIKSVISKTDLEESKLVIGQKNDVLIPSSGETAIDIATASCLQQDNVILGGDLNVFRSSKLNGVFTSYQLNNSKRHEIAKLAQGASVVHVYNNQLSKLKLNVPKLEEQNKIASFLSLIDDKISLQSEKVEALKDYKKGMMQKIFSRELRFKDDDGRDYPEWEEKKLSELVIFTNGKAHENCIDEFGDYMVVNSKFISSDGNVVKLSNENLCPLKKDDIVMVMSDVPNGKALAKCYLIDENDKYTLNQRICGLRSKGVDCKFLYYSINRNRYYLKFDNGVGQTNLRKDEVLECPILLPCKAEQVKIGSLLFDLDIKLEKEQEKLDFLNEYKKGLLQQMFV